MATDDFELFLSCCPDQGPAKRFGTATLIGAERHRLEPRRIDYQPERIVGIPRRELARYRREYGRLVKSRAVRERTRGEYEAALAAELTGGTIPAPTE